jgi:hypothetical protein
LSETDALLAGYAQAALYEKPVLEVRRTERHYDLPALPLPPPYRDLLLLFGEHAKAWQVEEQGWPLARALYERLGIALQVSARPG